MPPSVSATDPPKTPQKGVGGPEGVRNTGVGTPGQVRKGQMAGVEESKSAKGSMGAVAGQLAKDFLGLVKKGSIKEILSFIRTRQ